MNGGFKMEENKSKKYGICRYGNKKCEVQDLSDVPYDKVRIAIFDTYEDALNAIEQLEKMVDWREDETSVKS